MPGTFVSIGNGTQSFSRLLNEVKRIAPGLPQPVVVQHGRTPFESDEIEHFDFVDEADFKARVAGCELFITHGGGGSVFTALRLGRKAVVVPRLKRYAEIVDDHQLAFAAELERQGVILVARAVGDLREAARLALQDPALPQRVEGERRALNAVIEAVNVHTRSAEDKVLLVTPSGGHLTEVRALAPAYSHRPHHFVVNVPFVLPPDMMGRTTVISLSQRDWRFAINLKEAWDILRRERPQVILTTGGGFSVAFTLIGRLLGVPTIYIETVAKVIVPTMTGRAMYRLADRFFYQWPALARFFPRGEYIGLVL